MLKGVYTALITPFKGEEVDFEGLKKLVQFQIDGGVDGIVALGSTGETPTLSEREQELILSFIAEEINGRIIFIAGTGTSCTKKTALATKRAQELGADMALIVTPYYNKPTDDGIIRHYEAIMEKSDLPLIVYNCPGRCGKAIDSALLLTLSQLPQIVGIKDAGGSASFEAMMDSICYLQTHRPEFCYLSGDDNLTLPLMAIGGDGIISVASNLFPQYIVMLFKAIVEENWAQARDLHYQLLPLFKNLFIETNPLPIKAAMDDAGLPAGPCRLPLSSLSNNNRAHLLKVVREVQSHFDAMALIS